MIDSSKGFTLIEAIVVVLILTLVIAFAVPAYDTAVRKSHERNIALILRTLKAGALAYNAKNSNWYGGKLYATTDIGVINTGYDLNILLHDDYAIEYDVPDCRNPTLPKGCPQFYIRYLDSSDPDTFRAFIAAETYFDTVEPMTTPCCIGTGCPTLPVCVF